MGELTGMIKFSGRVGDTVGYRSNGRDLVRKAPKKQGGEPKSEAQKRQRDRWRDVSALAKAANDWQKSHITGLKISAYNNVIKYNASYLSAVDADAGTMSLPSTYFDNVVSVSDLSLTGHKLTATIGELGECAEIIAIAFDPKSKATTSKIIKEPGIITLDIPAPLGTGDKVYLFVQGAGADGALTEVQSQSATAV